MTSLSYTQNVKKCHGNAHATPWCTSAQAELVFGTKYTVIIRDTSFGLYYTLPTSGKGVSIFYLLLVLPNSKIFIVFCHSNFFPDSTSLSADV